MRYCALKKDCMAYFIFNGMENEGAYPEWYANTISKETYLNEYQYYVFVGGKVKGSEKIPWDDVLTEGYDVFLRNKIGNVMRTNIYQLDHTIIEVADGTVALSSDCVPYAIYNGGDPYMYPIWFQDFYFNTLKNIMTDKVELPIVVLMKEEMVDKEVESKYQILDFDLFKKNYYFQGKGIDWNGFEYPMED